MHEFNAGLNLASRRRLCSPDAVPVLPTTTSQESSTTITKNVTGMLQVVNFTGLGQVADKLQQTCQFHQLATSLLKLGLLQLVICRLVATC